uniref:RSN1_7TM domain-containing protein n=1 Tax=Syphacia muris TaxID=451379 RepID=A0A0N5AYI2_9BILA
MFAGFLFSFVPLFYEVFTLTGAQLVRFEIWRLITHCFIERNLLLLMFSTYAFLVLQSFIIYLFIKLHNSQVVHLSYLPDSILLTTPVCRFKNTHLPAIAVFFACIFAAFGMLRWIAILQMIFGVQVAWMYLRFYQYHEDGEPKGDPSEHFAWATLFPSKLQPLMNWIGTMFYVVSIRLRICKPVIRRIDISHLESISILPTSQSKEAERKRQKAIRDLTERLSRSQRDDTGNWPEMDIADDEVEIKQEAETSQEVHFFILH